METVYKSGSVDSIVDATAAKLKGSVFIVYCADDMRIGEISKKLHEKMPEAQDRKNGCSCTVSPEKGGAYSGRNGKRAGHLFKFK